MLAAEGERRDVLTEPDNGAGHAQLVENLCELLLSRGRLDASEISRARSAASAAGNRLDQALIELGLLTANELPPLLRELGVLEHGPNQLPDFENVPQIGSFFWSAARIVPLGIDSNQITLGMVDPFDEFSAQAVALKLRRRVRRVHLSAHQLEDWLGSNGDGEVEATSPTSIAAIRADDVQLLREAATDAPVVRFVQATLRDAVARGASDIHLRPTRNGGGEVLLRVSGALVSTVSTPTDMLPGIISRLKILADLDISERRRPQDGRLTANIGGRLIDVRLSTMPNIEGEGAVLRLLAREDGMVSLAQLGFSSSIAADLARLYGTPNGLILVTGPTGSGKTTTQHSALRELIQPGINVVTIEDPVEYRLEGAAQIQIDEKVGLTFPVVLRSLLRQDPDVIFVGEIRDGETAKIAVQAALTGHLVLATLHTNSAADAVPRLIDMGVEPYLLSAVLRGVLSQRLLRKPCPHCGVSKPPPPEATAERWIDLGTGCDNCSGNGHLGRTAVGELLLLDSELTGALSRSGASSSQLAELLATRGHRSLRDDIFAAADMGLVAAADALAADHA